MMPEPVHPCILRLHNYFFLKKIGRTGIASKKNSSGLSGLAHFELTDTDSCLQASFQ